jgi:two-component system chemotaxis response regulator CheB
MIGLGADNRDGGAPFAGIEAVVIGASAGAVEALTIVLTALPRNYSLPVFVVVHLPADRSSVLPGLFANQCQIRVKEVEDKEPIEKGTIYFAPPNYHMLIELDGHLSLSQEAPVLYSRPSIDVLFESATDVYGASLLGIILTGANSDGAKGLKALCDRGGAAIVQDPREALSQAMPLSAINQCPAAQVMTLDAIAALLRNLPERS